VSRLTFTKGHNSMEDSLIYLVVVLVAGLLSALFYANRRGNQAENAESQRRIQTGWQVGRRVNEMTDEPIVWVSVMSDSGTEILQLDRENDVWGMNFSSAAPLKNGNLVFRFDNEPAMPVAWTQFAAGRRAVLSSGDIVPLVRKLSTASVLKIQFVTMGDMLKVSRFDMRGFKSAAGTVWPLALLP
jgi:hypothetical protein